MQRIVEEIRNCLVNQCHFAALALALTIPNVCATYEKGSKATRYDYARWCNQWLPDDYDISGEVIYCLRCAFLLALDADLENENFYKEYQKTQSKSGEIRPETFKFFFPHEDTGRAVVYLQMTDEEIHHEICVGRLANDLATAYEAFVEENPTFSHEFTNLWIEG